MKFNTYGNRKEILKFPDHYVNVAITVSDEGVSTNEYGRKIVPAGTILGGGVLENEKNPAVKTEIETEEGMKIVPAEGVLFNGVDVTEGPAKGELLIHGFIDATKLPKPPTTAEQDALKCITFIA